MFTVFIEQLKDGRKEKINFTTPADFLDLHEAELSLPSPVEVHGEAYVTPTHLVLQLTAKTEIVLPCAICNTPTPTSLVAKNICFTAPLDILPSAIYDFTHVVRDELGLLIPQFIECQSGHCPARADLEKYTKKPDAPSPFANLPMP